ncbi:hypothetical protein MNBD_CPR01-446 [hydrothermal vent metagenome]|uniref:Uncharacterized protein n=1 Tax=hydrothermal vent metagenome TaxID=652676 RepID=A0A3B0VJI6_9ZZZZ
MRYHEDFEKERQTRRQEMKEKKVKNKKDLSEDLSDYYDDEGVGHLSDKRRFRQSPETASYINNFEPPHSSER